jgi:hypothetical protein
MCDAALNGVTKLVVEVERGVDVGRDRPVGESLLGFVQRLRELIAITIDLDRDPESVRRKIVV